MAADQDENRWGPLIRRSGVLVQTRAIRWVLFVALAAVLVSCQLYAVGRFGTTKVEGRRHFLVSDDIMISMCYGRNIARGNGPVLNSGERVEGFTNPLWTLYTGALHLLPIPERLLPAFLHGANLLLSLGLLWVLSTWHAGNRGGPQWLGLLAGAFYVALPMHIVHAHEGFEVYLLSLVALVGLMRVRSHTALSALALGLLPLVHGVGLPLLAALLLGVLADQRLAWSRRLTLCAVACIPFGAYEVFRIAYYSDILPNTYWLKADAGSFRAGADYVRRWAWAHWPLCALASVAFIRPAERRVSVAFLVLGLFSLGVAKVGGDIFRQFRFMVPMTALICWLAAEGAGVALRSVANAGRAVRIRTISLLLALLALQPINAARAAYSELWPLQVARDWNVRRAMLGKAINLNTPSDALVAVFALGYAAYYADRTVIDMLGKADHHIARQPPDRRRPVGHNKTDFNYVLARRPFVVETAEGYTAERLSDADFLAWERRRPGFGFAAELASDSTFQQRYRPNVVLDPEGRELPFCTRAATGPWAIPSDYFERMPDELYRVMAHIPKGAPVR